MRVRIRKMNLGKLWVEVAESGESLGLEDSVGHVAGSGPGHGLERNVERLLQGGGR